MDKFILGENPMRPESSGLFIIHLLDPIAIIECSDTGYNSREGVICRTYQFKNAKGVIEEWTLAIYHLFTTDVQEQPADRSHKLLDRAWRWYRAYMDWEDKNIEAIKKPNTN